MFGWAAIVGGIIVALLVGWARALFILSITAILAKLLEDQFGSISDVLERRSRRRRPWLDSELESGEGDAEGWLPEGEPKGP